MHQAVDFERVLPQHALGQAAADLVRQRRLDDRPGDVRGRIDLADADQAGVGVDLHDQGFLAAIAALVDVGEAEVNGLDAGDFHGGVAGKVRAQKKVPPLALSASPSHRKRHTAER